MFAKIIFGLVAVLGAVFAMVVFQLNLNDIWGFPLNVTLAIILGVISLVLVTALVKDKKSLYYVSAALVFVVLGFPAYLPVGFSLSYHPDQSLFDLIIPLYGLLLAFSLFLGFIIHRHYKKRLPS
jgi:hypothetical protein